MKNINTKKESRGLDDFMKDFNKKKDSRDSILYIFMELLRENQGLTKAAAYRKMVGREIPNSKDTYEYDYMINHNMFKEIEGIKNTFKCINRLIELQGYEFDLKIKCKFKKKKN